MRRPPTSSGANGDANGHVDGRREFGEVVRDLLIERGFTTAIGNPDWPRFAGELEGVNYETLRKAVTRERMPSAKVMESVAARLGVDPATFWEYELERARQSFDPRRVGDDEAFANLRRWLAL